MAMLDESSLSGDANFTFIGIFALYNRGGFSDQLPIWQCDRCKALVEGQGDGRLEHLKWHLNVR